MTQKTLGELANLVKGTVVGDPSVVITGVAGIREAGPGDITYAVNGRYVEMLKDTKASAAVVSAGTEAASGIALIRVEDAEGAFSTIIECFAPEPVEYPKGIHPTAVISKEARLGKDVSVGAYTVIERGASVGDETVILPHVYVGERVSVGSRCLIYPSVTLRERVVVGDRCIIHASAVIGSDGFGYVTRRGRQEKIPQLGTVVIEDDVEIGACTTIDRARFDRTWIRKGTKIDNLVQIGHNVVIGENCLLVSMVGICGSAHIGNNVVVAGKSSVNNHITVGDHVFVGALSGVTRSVPPHARVSGYPAQEHEKELRLAASLKRVPELMEQIRELERKVRDLERKADHDS